MNTAFAPGVNSIDTEERRLDPFLAALFATLGDHIRTMTDSIERRFAEFAGVPYQSPLSRLQWQELWEMEMEP